MKILNIIAITITIFATSFAAQDNLADGSVAFTAKFLKQVATDTPKQNVVFSPLGIQILMGLLTAAAPERPIPAITEIISVMELPPQNTMHQQFKDLIDAIEAPDDDLLYFDANKMYFGEDCTIKKPFADRATKFYKAGTEVIDFKDEAAAVKKINSWVESETDKKVVNFLTADKISANTKFIFISALYFKGKWLKHFEKKDTTDDEIFSSGTGSSGMTVVKMMKSYKKSYDYFEDNHAQYLKLDLVSAHVDAYMVLVLPLKKNGLEDLVQNHLKTALFAHSFQPAEVTVSVPKFNFTSDIPVKTVLRKLGLTKVFENGVVLNGFNFKGNVFFALSDFFQKTAIGIDEFGVTLIADTAYRGDIDDSILPQKVFYAGHPFLFYIKTDDVIVSAGQIYKP